MMITIADFERVDVRVGTILDVRPNKKSSNPAYVLTIDFGREIGVKKSSSQISKLYEPDALIGRQIVCCVNLTPMHIGSVKSEVRVIGIESNQGVVLLNPERPVTNGNKVY